MQSNHLHICNCS